MALEDYLVDSVQLCWKCQNACGGCPWTEVDPVAKKVRFEPVPGWTAKPVKRITTSGCEKIIVDTYSIKACPLFIPDEPRTVPTRNHSI